MNIPVAAFSKEAYQRSYSGRIQVGPQVVLKMTEQEVSRDFDLFVERFFTESDGLAEGWYRYVRCDRVRRADGTFEYSGVVVPAAALVPYYV